VSLTTAAAIVLFDFIETGTLLVFEAGWRERVLLGLAVASTAFSLVMWMLWQGRWAWLRARLVRSRY
jgi:amino acid transporter